MERSRLKNIILLILVLVNAMMLIALASTRIQESNARKRLTSQLVAMFENNGIVLNAEKIPAELPPTGTVLHRNTNEERTMAVLFLGKSPETDNAGGGIYTYSTSRGNATFRTDGSFEITGRLGSSHIEKLCRKFCSVYGYKNLKLTLRNGKGQGKATQYYKNGKCIVNCTVSFLIEGDSLVSVSGTHIPNPDSRFNGKTVSMTAATALTRFLEFHRQSGTVVSKIKRIFPCYRLKSSVSAPMSLVPIWRIVTDTGNYDVNCTTGTVTQA